VIVEVLKISVESRVEKRAYKLQCILNSPDQTSVDDLDNLLTDYVIDINKLKMLNDIINSSTPNNVDESQQGQPEGN